jgi:uncharacterized protein YecE (DUF72 family)
VHFGTSTWTYPGWKGLVYTRDYPKAGASAAMLAEYARYPLFSTVGVDSFFYAPPTPRTLEQYAEALPPGFRCVTKVWDRITVETFESPKDRALQGQSNPDFLNADLFLRDVVEPMRGHFADHVGPFVFEFQRLRGNVSLDQFVRRLDAFLGSLPADLPYAVELRNRDFLHPEYFALLRTHGVAHVFNSWTAMPRIGEQLLLHDSITAPFLVARALLRPGRRYAEAVDLFAPYDRIREPNPELRSDLAAVARTAYDLRIPAYIIVNNRAEGSAPETIREVARLVVDLLGRPR